MWDNSAFMSLEGARRNRAWPPPRPRVPGLPAQRVRRKVPWSPFTSFEFLTGEHSLHQRMCYSTLTRAGSKGAGDVLAPIDHVSLCVLARLVQAFPCKI